MMSFNTFASLFLVVCCFRYPYKDADKQATLTGWGILIATWFVSRFVASPLVRDPKCGMSQTLSQLIESMLFQSTGICASKVCPCTTFCLPQKPGQRRGVYLLAAPHKDLGIAECARHNLC